MRIRSPLLVAFWLLAPGLARADSLIAQGTPPLRVTVTGFADGKLFYTTAGGSGERDYAKVQQLVVDSEPALSAAEAARVNQQPDVALDDYAKAVRGSAVAWVKAYAAKRIFDADTPRFEPRLLAYLAMLQAGSADAAGCKPALPDRASRLLDVTVAEAESALKAPNLSDAARLALFDFLIEVHQRRGDEAAVTTTVERMARSSPAAANDPAVHSRLIGLKVTRARTALEKKDYAAAERTIIDARPEITDPHQQADALFVLAQARLARTDAADVPARQDAALAFMRVVVLGNTLPDRPNVLPSLRAVADILDQTGDAAGAANVKRQIAREFSNDSK